MDGDASSKPTNPITLGTSAAGIAVATAVLYVVGSLYTGSYYGALGFGEGLLTFTVQELLYASLLPLLVPFIWIVFWAAACHALARDTVQVQLFPPIPAVYVFSTILWLWVIKVFLDLTQPSAGVEWFIYDRRDALFVVVGLLAFVFLYRHHSGKDIIPRPQSISASTWNLVLVVLVGNSIFAADFVLQGGLTIKTYQWVIMGVAGGFAVAFVIYDVVRHKRAADDPAQETDGPAAPDTNVDQVHARLRGSRILWGLMAVFALILASGLSGAVNAQEAMLDCPRMQTVTFTPVPEGLDADVAYWLVAHQGGAYYLRSPPDASEMVLHIVHDEPGLTATIGRGFPASACV